MDKKYYIKREYETEPETTEAVIRRAQPFKGRRNTFIFQICNNPQPICDSNKIVYPTPYSSLYIYNEGRFDMDTEKAKKNNFKCCKKCLHKWHKRKISFKTDFIQRWRTKYSFGISNKL